MKVITYFNNKGGVGKTSLLCNVAAFLKVEMGRKVLIVDADPQCNASVYTLGADALENLYEKGKGITIQTFVDSLKRGKGFAISNQQPIRSPRFEVDIVPGDPRLALSEDLLAADWKAAISGDARGLQTTFMFLDLFERFSSYDYIFVDVGPSLGAINRSVLLASDYFLMPMSSDIFSLMAVKNISLALLKWRRDLERGLTEYEEEEGDKFKVGSKAAAWKLRFLGYATQQYTAKSVGGTRQPVKAYDRIIKKIGPAIQRDIAKKLNAPLLNIDYKIGTIPNLNSIIPLSQNASAPIFSLKGRDGVVGAHFDKVREAYDIMMSLSERVEENLTLM